MDSLRFAFPWALALLVAVPWSIWIGSRIKSLSPSRRAIAITLRTIILVCLIAALAGTELVHSNDRLAVFFLLDQSDSVPEESRLAAAQWVRNAADRYMTPSDKAGVIVFGKDASIELGVAERLGLRDIQSFVNGEATDLAAAVRIAQAAFPQGHMKRIVLYTDGNETQGALLEEVKRASAGGVGVDIVPLAVGQGGDVRIREVSTPSQADADEPFQLQVIAHSDADTEATLRVFQRVGNDRRMLAPQRVNLQAGDNTFVLTQELRSSGFYEYEVTIEAEEDSVLANNRGRSFTIVQGEPRVLLVATAEEDTTYLEAALRNEGIDVEISTPGGMPASLSRLQNYDAIAFVDVASVDLSSDQLASTEAMVRDLGIGFVMIGGPDAFGSGGYLDTPVERALPVDMDIKQRKVLPRGALALILHTCEFQDGNTWAREIALASLNVLSAQDMMGVLGYMWGGTGGTGDKWIAELAPVGDKQSLRRTIRRASQQIGDMPSVEPTLRLAFNGLKNADAAAKRIVMISDGDPAAPPKKLVDSIADAGISISTVCINPHSPNDTGMLKRLANDTGGSFYFVRNPRNLPQIFTKEAAVVKRGLLIERSFVPEPYHESELLFGLSENAMPPLLGYVATTAKDSATIALVSDEGDPVLAHWRYGLGKAVAFTSDASSRWGAEWLGWEGYNRFWAQAIRWATRELSPSSFNIDTAVRDGNGRIRIDAVDEAGRFINFLRPRGVVTGPGPDFERREIELPQVGPGIYETDFPVDESGVYMINLLYDRPDGSTGSVPAGLALSYSPEYEHTGQNVPLLESAVNLSGGRLLDPAENPFRHDLPIAPSIQPIWNILALIAVCLFPLEIFVRRVVVPIAPFVDAARRVLRRIPGLRNAIREPALRPAPVTGSYMSKEAAQRSFADAAEGSFGEAPASRRDPETEAAPGDAPEREPAPETSAYTAQLLAAKDRAIERKRRRTGADE